MFNNFRKNVSGRPLAWIGLLALLSIVLSACATPVTQDTPVIPVTGPTAVPTVAPTLAPTAVPVPEASLMVVNDPKYGNILVDGKGMTLYMYTKDEPNISNCTGGCSKAWPPLLTGGNPTLGTGLDGSLIGNVTLADGTKIVTYNKMPLYYWAKDKKPGDTTGVGVGGVWFVVSPDGKVVGKEDAATPTAAVSEASINVSADPKYGKILVDGKGMTLYVFTKDGPDKSNCSAGCLKAWPPLLTHGKPMLGSGVDDSLIGSATLADGTMIVTYNKMPLYYWASDTKPGDITGLGVSNAWYLVSPDGKVVGK